MGKYFVLLLRLFSMCTFEHTKGFPINYKLANDDGAGAGELHNATVSKNVSALDKADSADLEEMIEKAFETYNMKFPPNFGRGPVVVQPTVEVLAVPLFREEDFRLILELELSQKWQDERLKLNTTRVIDLSPVQASGIWKPNIAFEGAQSKISSTFRYYDDYSLYPNGTILQISQMTLLVHCPFFLHDFPFDRRKCKIALGSSSYSLNTVVYKWPDDPLQFRKVALESLTQWTFPFFRLNSTVKLSAKRTESSRATFELLAVRDPSHVIKWFVIPMALLVIGSFIPTYIPDNHAARIISGVGMLGVTVGLVLQHPSGRANPVPYDTCYDYYRFACFLLVNLNLWQSAVFLCLKKREMSEYGGDRNRAGRPQAENGRELGCRDDHRPVRQGRLKCFLCFHRWRPQETDRERDVEAAVPDQEPLPVIRHESAEFSLNSSTWDKVCHTFTAVVTIILIGAGAIGINFVLTSQSDSMKGESWRATVFRSLTV